MQPVTVSVSEAAKALGLGRSITYELIHSGDLRVIKIGRRTLVTVESIRSLVQGRSIAA